MYSMYVNIVLVLVITQREYDLGVFVRITLLIDEWAIPLRNIYTEMMYYNETWASWYVHEPQMYKLLTSVAFI